jgi:steroid 5-alpha reductase family enzyme
MSFIYHLFQIGTNLSFLEMLLIYLLPVSFLLCANGREDIYQLFLSNALCQLVLFLFVVQIPVFLTGKMIYVDIGWPTGLVALALQILLGGGGGGGWWPRRVLLGTCLLLHGARMALGALALFGSASQWTFRFVDELARYRFAAERWRRAGLPMQRWWLKQQHDTLQQCFANTVVLASPLIIGSSYVLSCERATKTTAKVACRKQTHFDWIEIIGLLSWFCCWICENIADAEKLTFIKRNAKKIRKARAENDEKKVVCEIVVFLIIYMNVSVVVVAVFFRRL